MQILVSVNRLLVLGGKYTCILVSVNILVVLGGKYTYRY